MDRNLCRGLLAFNDISSFGFCISLIKLLCRELLIEKNGLSLDDCTRFHVVSESMPSCWLKKK